jgi:serine/threonine-protein kinase
MTTQTSDPFVTGQRIDRYEIREHIGQGGMGAVYRAIDSKLGRTVALKTVVAHRRGDKMTEEIRERFMREALAASRVDHRNVVQVLDFGFADDGTPYMVMEYLRGQSLSAILKSAKAPLAIDYVADVMLSVCAALRACHHVGIIHRDLKPANIFLCDTDTGWEVKVLDFGISKAPATDDLTEDGQIVGTPQYLSPEQIDGTVGPESDQYALGVLMYVSLTGRLPYASYQSIRLLRAISEGTFAPPRTLRPDLPEGLEAIVLRAMHISAKQRFESIHALGQKLWDFASVRGQTQWKTFYFHTPAASQAAKQITLSSEPDLRGLASERAKIAPPAPTMAMPEPATAAPAPPAPATPTPRKESRRLIESTASLEPAEPFGKTEPAQETIGPSHFATTKTAAASGVGEPTSLSHSDIAGESALSDAPEAVRSVWRGKRWKLAAGFAAVAALAVVVVQRPSRNHPSPAPVSARAPAQPSLARAGAVVSTAAAPAPAPTAAAPTVPLTSPPPPPSASRSEKEGAPSAPPKRKRATRRHTPPKIDQYGIGIPAE